MPVEVFLQGFLGDRLVFRVAGAKDALELMSDLLLVQGVASKLAAALHDG